MEVYIDDMLVKSLRENDHIDGRHISSTFEGLDPNGGISEDEIFDF